MSITKTKATGGVRFLMHIAVAFVAAIVFSGIVGNVATSAGLGSLREYIGIAGLVVGVVVLVLLSKGRR